MKRLRVSLLTIVVALGTAQGTVLDQAQEQMSGYTTIDIWGSSYVQTFTCGVTGQLDHIDVRIAGEGGTGDPGYPTAVGIVNVVAGEPVLPPVAQVDSVIFELGWNSVDFVGLSVFLTSGTQYGIMLANDDTTVHDEPTAKLCMKTGYGVDAYAGGSLLKGDPGSWEEDWLEPYLPGSSPLDACFRTYMVAGPEPGPTVPPGYTVEAYVTGLRNVNAIAFSPGGDFGYEAQLFVGDSRPDPGTIYRVPSKGNKIFFTSSLSNEPRSFEFSPVGSPFGSFLFVSDAYRIRRYDNEGVGSTFASINAFGWDLAFGPGGAFGTDLYHADGWEPAGDGEAIRMWDPSGTPGLLIGNLPEETNGLAFGPGGLFGEDLYIAFSSSRGSTPAIRRVAPDGTISDFVISPQFGQTNQLAFDTIGNFRGNLFVSDFEHDVIFEIDPAGEAAVFATGFSFSSTPHHKSDGGDLVFGPDGALYVADGGAGVVWRIAAISRGVAIDIKPQSCPNPLNVVSRGVLPVAVLGTDTLDANSIDIASIRLEGVAPVRSSFEDVASPLEDGSECECTTEGPDGYSDLTLKFKTWQIAEAIGPVVKGQSLALILTGTLTDGTPFQGSDCIVIVGNVPRALAARKADVTGDGLVDMLDFSTIAQYWLESCIIDY